MSSIKPDDNISELLKTDLNKGFRLVILHEDMSKVLKTSEGALKASYHHAVKKIEKVLGED